MSLVLEKLVLPLAAFTLEVDAVFAAPVTGLVGASGAGKTSLLELVAGLRTPARGRVLLNGLDLTPLHPWQRQIGYVPQDQALFPHLGARENFLYAARARRQPVDETWAARLVDALELAPLLDRRVSTLSGGERGRIALGRALLSRPRLLLLDEPLAHVDERLRDRALAHLRDVPQLFGVPLVFVSHSSAEIAALGAEVVWLEKGRVIGGQR